MESCGGGGTIEESGGSASCGGGDVAKVSCAQIDHADAVIGFIGDVEVSVGADGKGAWVIEARSRSKGIEESSGATRNCGDDTCRGDHADTVVVAVGYIEVSVGAAHDIGQARAKACVCGGAVCGACGGSSCKGGDFTVGIDHADAVVAGVGDEQIAVGVEDKGGWGAKTGLEAGAFEESGGSCSCEGGDVAAGVDHADTVVARVGDVEVSVAVVGHALGVVETGENAAAVGKATEKSASRVRGDVGLQIDLADAVVLTIGDVQEAAGIGFDACRRVEACGGSRGIDKIACRTGSSCVEDHVVGGSVEMDTTDVVVGVVGDIEITREGDGDIVGIIKTGDIACAVGTASGSRSSNGGDVAEGVDSADAVVIGVGDVDIAVAGDDHTTRRSESCGGSRAIQETRSAHPCVGRYIAEGIDFSDDVVSKFSDIEVALRVDCESVRVAQTCGG